jgi:hypothetical protein
MSQFNDLAGIRFTRWTVLRFSRMIRYKRRKRGRQSSVIMAYWTCRCSCGREKEIRGTSLTAQRRPTLSCGCLAAELSSKRLLGKCGLSWPGRPYYSTESRIRNLVGEKFGKWRVIARGNRRRNSCGQLIIWWVCECTCPLHTRRAVLGRNLVAGRSLSCGLCRPRDSQGRLKSA